MTKVFLIGMPGSGKSTVGRLLAKKLGVPFSDTDAIFVDRYGPIPSFFETNGERAFREREREIMVETAGDDSVVGLGGGAVLHPDALTELKKAGKVVYLSAREATLWSRLKSDRNRPLLKGGREALRALFERRIPLYEEAADRTVFVDGRSSEEIADEIISLFKTRE